MSHRHLRSRLSRAVAIGAVATTTAGAAAGCGVLDQLHDAVYGDYHRLSPATGGVYMTIKRYATNDMIEGYNTFRYFGSSEARAGTDVLRAARREIERNLRGRALEVWNGDYSVFGYHPDLGKGFRDEEGGDLATAIKDLRARNHQCLRVHWKPSGTNWTTVQDAGVTECEWGKNPR